MTFFFDMVALAAGLVLGGVGGYAIGVTWRDDRRTLWAVAIGAFVVATLFNFVGRYFGLEWVSIGSIGLMAGVTTGVKYGGFPDVRVWEKPPARDEEAPADEDGEGEPVGKNVVARSGGDVVESPSDDAQERPDGDARRSRGSTAE